MTKQKKIRDDVKRWVFQSTTDKSKSSCFNRLVYHIYVFVYLQSCLEQATNEQRTVEKISSTEFLGRKKCFLEKTQKNKKLINDIFSIKIHIPMVLFCWPFTNSYRCRVGIKISNK